MEKTFKKKMLLLFGRSQKSETGKTKKNLFYVPFLFDLRTSLELISILVEG